MADLLAVNGIHRPTDLCGCDAYGEDMCEYRMLANLIEDRLNPPDEDAAEVSVVMDAVTRIADFVVSLPCTCPADVAWPEYADPCPRCAALGRRLDVPEQV